MKKSYRNILKAAIAVFILSFIIAQVYHSLYNPFSTESAAYYSTYDGVSFTGVSIRSENVLSAGTGGVVSFAAESGQRVSKNSVIANVYATSEEAQAASRVSEIDQQISELQNLSGSGGTSADLTSLEDKIFDGYVNLLSDASEDSFGEVDGLASNLLTLLNKKQVAIGKSSDFNALIASLESERSSLSAAGIRSSGTITTPNSGYFVSSVDGLEEQLTPETAMSLTPEKLDNLTADSSITSNAAGKVVSDYEWYIAANVSTENALRFTEGSSLTLKTDLSSMPELPVTVTAVNYADDDSGATVIFACKYMNSELSSVRKQPLTAVLKSYSGLRISTKAVRVVDGQKGVYVVSGSTAKFKQVDIIYTSGGYCICSMDSSDSSSLGLYDEVIVKGKNLYDGKVVE